MCLKQLPDIIVKTFSSMFQSKELTGFGDCCGEDAGVPSLVGDDRDGTLSPNNLT